MNKDARVLAYCNLFGVLGAIPKLIELDPDAAALVRDTRISVGFAVKGGPHATLSIRDGRAAMKAGTDACSIKLWFPSCEKFNALIDVNCMPIPVSGFWHVGFLLNGFTKLTDILSAYLRPTPERLEDPTFFERSTVLMLHVIAGAVAAVGNEDPVGRFSASNIVDGVIKLSIGQDIAVAVCAEGGRLSVCQRVPKESFSEMSFVDLKTAHDLFDGKINAVAAVGEGKVRVAGMISQVDNVNRILDRVSLYLA